MIQLIDTHTHIYSSEFDSDRTEVIHRAMESGVVKFLLPNIDAASISPMIDLCHEFKDFCFPMIGLHPTSIGENYRAELKQLLDFAEQYRFVAVGETGLDLYWDKRFLKEQIDALTLQIDFSIQKHLPVAIHSRESTEELFAVLNRFKGQPLTGVLHAFSGSPDDAAKAVDMGFMIGIGGPVTYKKSTQAEVVRRIGIHHIVLETDSPYLPPVPYRGKRNESAYIDIVNRKVAEIAGITPEESASATTKNASELFNLPFEGTKAIF